jgi:leader peptidase (prepilin peptidase)/N-methyltransferase
MDWVWPLVAAPFVGSFLGVLIRRLPEGRLLTPARSCCEGCGVALGWRDLVPLVSYALLRGRCRACGAAIAAQHWQVELASVAVAGSAAVAGAPWTACLFGWSALALAWIDWDWLLLPDAITLPLVLAGVAVTAWAAPWDTTDHAIAAALGFLSVQALAWCYRRLRGRDGIGGGDAKFLAAIGAWVGLEGLPAVVFGAALVGIAGAMVMRARGQAIDASTPIPFGCCLAIAGWVVLLLVAVPAGFG